MTRTATILLVSKALRGYADGGVSILLVGYLTRLGLSTFEVGAIVTGTLFGSALLTIAVGLAAARLRVHRVLFGACLLMVGTGVGFASLSSFWPLFIVAVLGTLNPSSGDVSVFLPMEQTLVAGAAPSRARVALFARYNLVGTLAGALGALGGGFLARHAEGAPRGIEPHQRTAQPRCLLIPAPHGDDARGVELRLALGLRRYGQSDLRLVAVATVWKRPASRKRLTLFVHRTRSSWDAGEELHNGARLAHLIDPAPNESGLGCRCATFQLRGD